MSERWLEHNSWVIDTSIDKTPKQEAKEQIQWIENEVKKEQKTILYLAYLTTLARLPENRDLDELFDWEIQLWEEELFSVYSLLEIINWSNSINTLKAPKKMDLDWNWAQDYDYNIDYEEFYLFNWKIILESELNNLSNEEKQKVKKKKVIKSITWDWTLPLNQTSLIFNYDKNANISGIKFERPTNWIEWWGLGVDQEIKFKREKWLVTKLSVVRDLEVDNNLSIKYNKFWKPEIIEHTKLWLISDKTVFEYDNNWELISIIYMPSLSIKHIKGVKKAFKNWKSIWWIWKWIEMAWNFITFEALKKMKWNDIINITNKWWLPVSTESTLWSSRWYYKEGNSTMKYKNNQLQELYLQLENLWPDDKKKITLEY